MRKKGMSILLGALLCVAAPGVAMAAPPDDVELSPGKRVEIEQTEGGSLVGTVDSMSGTGIKLKLDGGAVVTVPYDTIASVKEPGADSGDGGASEYRVEKRDGTALVGAVVESTDDELVLEQGDGTQLRIPYVEVASIARAGAAAAAAAPLVGRPVVVAGPSGGEVAWGTLESVAGGVAQVRTPDGDMKSLTVGDQTLLEEASRLVEGPGGDALCGMAEATRAEPLSVTSDGQLARVPVAGLAYACNQAGRRVVLPADAETRTLRVAELARVVGAETLPSDQVAGALVSTLRREASEQIAALAGQQIAGSPEIQHVLKQVESGAAVSAVEIVGALDQLDKGVGSGLGALAKNLGTPESGHQPIYAAGLAPVSVAAASSPGALAWADGQDRILAAVAAAGSDPAGARTQVEAEMRRMARLRAADILARTNIAVVDELALVEELRAGQLDLEAATTKLEELVEKRIGGDFKLEFAEGGIKVEWSMTLEDAEAKRQAWIRRGGTILSFRGDAYGLYMNIQGMSGGGGGGTLGARGLFLKPPIPNERKNFLMGFLGTGLQGMAISFSGNTIGQLQVPAEVGGGIGIGKFRANGKWKGAAVSASYKPSLNIPLGMEGAKPTFNYIGFELGLDVVTLDDYVAKYAERAHLRIYGFFLPPVGNLPTLVMIGLGGVWY